jgi:membrane protease YdiL (CAAX protease family)
MMSEKKQIEREVHTALPATARAAFAFLMPLAGSYFLTAVARQFAVSSPGSQVENLPFFAGLGLVSLFLGLRWYGLPQMGLRGGRPLFSSISFAVLGWIALLVFRFYFISIRGLDSGLDEFFYRLLFEAFCVQLWTFGLLFRSLADWRGPLTAAITSGILFGLMASLRFQEAPEIPAISSLLYFLLWGLFYGIVRLRSGSFLGSSLVQAIQSFTAWVVLTPDLSVPGNNFSGLYIATGLAYLVFMWRLWPKQEEDYRV